MKSGRMFVITLRKGGVGKTTVAMNLAIYLRQVGRNVAYLDLDPQRDGYEFFKDRIRLFPELPEVTHLALEDPEKVESAMRSVATAGADVVVDCPPLDPPQVVRAQEVGDFLKPKRPSETDLLALVQNGFNAQLPKDRAAQTPPQETPQLKPEGKGGTEADPASIVPMARITIAIPEELRFRLKLVLMNHRRMGRAKITQDEYCAKAIVALLDLEGSGTDLRGQVAKVVEFLRGRVRAKALTKGWDAKAQALFGELGEVLD